MIDPPAWKWKDVDSVVFKSSSAMSLSLPKPRPDYQILARRRRDDRSLERITAHYVLERILTDRLLSASAAERATVYGEVYSELFASLPDHPQHTRTPDMNSVRARYQMGYLGPFLYPDTVFMEVGCGDAHIAQTASRHIARAYGLDVTDALINYEEGDNRFEFLRTDGIAVPLPDNTIDVTYSNQLMEHLHADDAAAQLKEIWRTLKVGGRYVCITPNRVTGPHDVSCYFDYEASCFHVREYDYRELRDLLREAGFRTAHFKVASRGLQFPMPFWIARGLESLLSALPLKMRAAFSRHPLVSVAMGLYVVAKK